MWSGHAKTGPIVPLFLLLLVDHLGVCLKTRELQGDGTTMTEMMDFMEKFGYMPESSSEIGHLMTVQEIKQSVKMVQRLAGLPESGRLDDATARYIKRPRCGVTDINLVNQVKGEKRRADGRRSGRRKRYTHYRIGDDNAKWKRMELTWSLDRRGTPKVDRRSVLSDLERAFRLWSDSSKLRFRQLDTGEKPDIEISFVRENHGDGYAFDGQGRTLAHAFPPQGGSNDGDMHMDDDEHWKSHADAKRETSEAGVSVFVVAAHELGHSLGLDHSKDVNALMYAAYTGPQDFLTLPDDDRIGIQLLYGSNDGYQPDFRIQTPRPKDPPRRTTTTTTTEEPSWAPARTRPPVTYRPPPPKSPRTSPRVPRPGHSPSTGTTVAPLVTDFCNTIFDVVTTIRGELFLFKNELMWRVKGSNREQGPHQVLGPTRTADFWRGLPADLKKVDAVYERQITSFDIIFFIGDQYYAFFDTRLRISFPRPISYLGFPPDVSRVDAALAWGHRGRTYLFSGQRYWRLDESSNRVHEGEDVSSNWRGVRMPISSSFRWANGKTYFFHDHLYWEFNESRKSVTHRTGLLVSPFWLGCPTGERNDDDNDNSVNNERERLTSVASLTSVTSPHKLFVVSLVVVFTALCSFS